MISPISNSEFRIFLANICYAFFFNWQTEKKNGLDQKETAQAEKRSWKKLVKTSYCHICNFKFNLIETFMSFSVL